MKYVYNKLVRDKIPDQINCKGDRKANYRILSNEEYLTEDTVRMSISFNGKTRFTMDFTADADNKTIEQEVLANEQTAKYLEGKQIVKIIIVPKRIVNIVLK